MRKIIAIIEREFVTRVRTKAFIFGTVAMPLLFIGLTVLPILLAAKKSETVQRIAVLDATGQLFPALEAALDRTDDAGRRVYRLESRAPEDGDMERAKEAILAEVRAGGINGFLFIPATVLRDDAVEFHTKSAADFRLNQEIQGAVASAVRERRIRDAHIEPAVVRDLMRPVAFRTFRIGAEGKSAEERGQTFMAAYLLAFFLYMAILIYGITIMRAVTEEKTSRVMELLVSSIRPFPLFAGKILGVGSAGLAQFAFWAVAAATIAGNVGPIARGLGLGAPGLRIQPPEMGAAIFIFFVVFFLLGYLLYASLYAAVGAMVSSEQEAQQAQLPIVLLVIVPMLFMAEIVARPNSTLSVVLSEIPFFAPVVMFTRIVLDMPPAGEIILCLATLVGTIALVVFLGSRIFRVGILMVGKPPTPRELLRWIRAR
ncbi:MAG: ABC transporter permease [Planctomycetes bacterium]|nr:ABC transporter permease [Planctomycetota bacterium]